MLIIYLATHANDRATLLLPTWFILFVWVTAAGFALLGYLHTDIAANALIGGLVLIHASGVVGLTKIAGMTMTQALLATSTFIPGDLVKCVLCALVCHTVARGLPDWRFANSKA